MSSLLNKIILLIGAAVLLIAGYIAYTYSGQTITEQFEGSIPFIWNRNVNLTVAQYTEARPSPYILLLGGGYQSGKSRLIEVLAQEKIENGRFVIKFDAAEAKSYDDFLSILKLAISNGLSYFKMYGSANSLLRASEKLDPSSKGSSTNVDNAISRIYSIFSKLIDSITEEHFSTESVQKFFKYLELISENLRPIIFIHNYDSIKSLNSTLIPKILDSLSSYLSRRNNYEQTIPVILEIKNSLSLINLTNSDIFEYFEMPELENTQQHYTVEHQIFTAQQLRKIIGTFGAHAGSLAKAFEDRRFGITIDDSISNQIAKISKIVKAASEGLNENSTKMICTKEIWNFDVFQIDQFRELIEEEMLYITKSLDLKFANKAVRNSLCKE
ncbi:hypothetical protein GPJ56_001533 [Histomonas meleagridis]|uniref:uncharacterized protein n=1 Tax=Histomonas meleagridis TaxID=135588 RepID=UPI00355AA614|nr:hypothetical protein GPJ56_001533 [Histomonas meleagridis]KAH0807040.1 hypothetical protein GO595_000216 [Histomonas meleagridis]